MENINIYQEKGYQNRKHYLQCMSEDYDVPINVVLTIAGTLGPNEDFDGLVTNLEDYEEME